MDKQLKFEKERDKIIEGLEETYKKLVVFKQQKNTPLVISKNGQIVEIAPKQIPPNTKYGRSC